MISDAHEGLRRAIATVLGGAGWRVAGTLLGNVLNLWTPVVKGGTMGVTSPLITHVCTSRIGGGDDTSVGEASMKVAVLLRHVLLSVFLALLFPLLAVANPGEVKTIKVNTLAVMPFGIAEKPFDKTMIVQDMVDCKIFGFCSWKKEDQGAKTITAIYQRQLRKRMGDRVLPWDRVEAVFEEIPPRPEETLRSAAERFGEENTASHVLTGTVWQYRERVGGSMTAAAPASVSFTAMLVRTKDGAILWSAHFDKTQTSLSDNLFDAPMFLKKGVKWLNVEELATFGVEETLHTFPRIAEGN